MLQVGRTQSTLESVGVFLAARDAQQIEISDEGPFISVSWSPTDAPQERRCFNDADIDQLRQMTRRDGPPSLSRAVLLSALGREIDLARVEVSRITEDSHGFVVSGTSGGRYVSWRCGSAELARAGEPEPEPPSEPVRAPRSRGETVPVEPPARPVADPHASPLRHRLQLTR